MQQIFLSLRSSGPKHRPIYNKTETIRGLLKQFFNEYSSRNELFSWTFALVLAPALTLLNISAITVLKTSIDGQKGIRTSRKHSVHTYLQSYMYIMHM